MVKFMLKYGDENNDVLEAQKLLKAAGSTINPTGKFTIGMVTAVKAFQKKNGLPVTGKIDTKTVNKLKTFAKPAKKTAKAVKAPKAKTVK